MGASGSLYGGYRRIAGFERIGPAVPGFGPVLGIVLAGGLLYATRYNEDYDLDTFVLMDGSWIRLAQGHA